MKAIVYGQENKYKELTASLRSEGIEMQKLENDFYTAGNLRSEEKYDLAIVDSRSDDANKACHYIRENWHIPLVLIVDSREVNWKRLLPMDADGYIPEVKKGGELSARVSAFLWRLVFKNIIPEEIKQILN